MAYRVMYVGRDVPMADFDGWAARLRLVDDSGVVQFFRAIAPSAEIAPLEPKPTPDWWTEFVGLAAAEIERAVEAGLQRTDRLGDPIDVWPDVAEAHSRSRTQNPDRRRFPATDVPFAGVEVHRFGPGSEREERRARPRD